jgi:hypothetical protein
MLPGKLDQPFSRDDMQTEQILSQPEIAVNKRQTQVSGVLNLASFL